MAESKNKTLKDLNQWHIAIIIALIGGVLFLKPYLSVIMLAALMAYIFSPVYKSLLNKMNKTASATLTTLFSFFVVLVPVAIILGLTVKQASTFVSSLQLGNLNQSGSISLNSTVEQSVDFINSTSEKVLNRSPVVDVKDAQEFVSKNLPKLGQAAINLIKGIVTGVPQFITLFILYLFIFIELLIKQDEVTDTIEKLSPFDSKTNRLYLGRIGSMTKGMVKGQFIIALCQGLTGALSLMAIGYGDYFFLAFVVLTLLSFIPLGGGIILIPIGIVLLLLGNIWQGIFILLVHFLVTTNIDNILRPKLVPKDAKMPASLTLLSAFAGIYHFGFLGIVYGPVIMIVILTTIQVYTSLPKSSNRAQ